MTDVDFQSSKVVVTVRLRSKRLRSPHCRFITRTRYDTRPVASSCAPGPRAVRLEVRADLRRIEC